ncbi:siderophore-interacting protein [Spirilliplanes yamanashiensis]|uniref:FAD-binding FR-type domain-containing protein n=1 Tax=Spirilliplanes yamanashiensis TaxID=42233 RepID=A0A8J4DIE0_9ACTN|nr:siderophore-interacting protein [Spirilliplanes yamanashiensis]MDP9817352.1 NADPH-dependent ferric siderophore reductase [Spirilliplanes yamanashiensis]GIJ02997.1 hypothetical protein Sya03_23490 [Spirilliplanes yamanashiensis]
MTSTLAVAPWRTFATEVRAVRRLSPSFLRVTLTGPDLDRFADNGWDQRIKVAVPVPGTRFPHGTAWYEGWRALPDAERPPLRTYTARHVRADRREIDVDFVLHGDTGPAGRWALRAAPGAELAVVGPDAGYPGTHGGIEFRPPAGSALLLAGDETAAPAICAILERLPADATGHALLEVPGEADALPVAAPAGVSVTWLPRGTAAHGSRLTAAVTADSLLPALRASAAAGRDDTAADTGILWDVPDAPAETPVYAWLAGEASTIRGLRRHLVSERGLDRRAIAFMGYWRRGHAEN